MRTPAILTTAAGLTLALSLTGCAGTTSSGSAGGSTSTATATATARGAAADIAFAQLMIPHHQQALEMADLASTRATRPEVRQLAAQIEAAQDPEITRMRGWLTSWGAPTTMPGASESDDGAGMGHGDMDMGGLSSAGMMTAEQMDTLMRASGEDFDDMWLQMMITHHQGAIAMAEQVLDVTTSADVRALAEAVVAGQADEVATMQQLLAR